MDSDDAAPNLRARAPKRAYVRFSSPLAREVCRRVAAGESQSAICADPTMPSRNSLAAWARQSAQFAKVFAQAKAMAKRKPVSGQGFCPATATEIVARVSEGEMLSAITADPLMPSLRTIFRWKADHSDFAEDLHLAREALAERLADLGWTMALEATPETAYLTHVRLGQLRWTASVLGPRTHGKLKPTAPPEPPTVTTLTIRHFAIEENAQGQHRVVSFTPDPATMRPVRTDEGEWKDPVDPVAKAQGVRLLTEADRRARRERPAGPKPDDPEGWC
jgi:hypothetical protein